MARDRTPMTMNDWDNSLNEFLKFRRREILEGKGKVSREAMERKVLKEYAIYNTRRLNTPSEDEISGELPDIKGEVYKKEYLINNRKEQKMKNNIGSVKNEITPMRLHLELKDDYLSDYQKRMLRRYGESISGDSITRDILIPSDMPLHNLHYAIQKLFGWQNSH